MYASESNLSFLFSLALSLTFSNWVCCSRLPWVKKLISFHPCGTADARKNCSQKIGKPWTITTIANDKMMRGQQRWSIVVGLIIKASSGYPLIETKKTYNFRCRSIHMIQCLYVSAHWCVTQLRLQIWSTARERLDTLMYMFICRSKMFTMIVKITDLFGFFCSAKKIGKTMLVLPRYFLSIYWRICWQNYSDQVFDSWATLNSITHTHQLD